MQEADLYVTGSDKSEQTVDFYSYPLLDDARKALMLKWRNRPDIRLMMSDEHVITAPEHDRFCRMLEHCDDKLYFIVEHNGVAAGSVNLRLSGDYGSAMWEWGLYFGVHISGLAKQSLCGLGLLCGRLGIDSLSGYFKRENERSRVFHLDKMGFAVSAQDERYIYVREDRPELMLDRLQRLDRNLDNCTYRFHLHKKIDELKAQIDRINYIYMGGVRALRSLRRIFVFSLQLCFHPERSLSGRAARHLRCSVVTRQLFRGAVNTSKYRFSAVNLRLDQLRAKALAALVRAWPVFPKPPASLITFLMTKTGAESHHVSQR